jgi:hypothetical protein
VENAPFIPPAVAEWLQKLFPLAMPGETDTDRSIWIAVGVQKVVRKVRLVSDEQQKNILQQK